MHLKTLPRIFSVAILLAVLGPLSLSAGAAKVAARLAQDRSVGKILGERAKAFVLAIEALLGRPREAWLRSVDRRLATQSWDATWEGMEELIRRIGSSTIPEESQARLKDLLA